MNTSEFRYCEVVGEETGKLLGEPLDPRLISHTTDEEDGFKKSYLTGHTVIAQLNRIFGYGGHSWEVTNGPSPIGGQGRGVDSSTGEILSPVGYVCMGRLTVKTKSGPVSFDGVGVESLDAVGTFGAHDMAIKGAETDAMKRAARHLGTQFGLSLYFGGTDMPAHFRANAEAPAKAEAAPAASEQGDNATRTQGSRPAAQSQSRGNGGQKPKQNGDGQEQGSRPAAQSPSRGNGGQKPKQNGDSQEQSRRPAAQSQSRANGGQKPKQNGDGQEQSRGNGGQKPKQNGDGQEQSRGNGGQKPLAPMPKLEQLSREEAEGLLIDYAKRQSDKVTAEVVRQQVLEHTGKPLAELEDAELRKMIASSYRKLRGR